ncbi:MAG TPA: CinA family nicotinamide mononucleotide deamidase-related protein [Anaerolineales bacterium]|nr:CinA family nicotinamide mononucleotide deamidase-related protein [Anaerolineales bacterium]HMX18125.1 CinA family nicotinamide mononucleotide deamidase-related protein [Anaerolineales bacterium]HNC87526.1 CinA family nicotinamide mononucleotide deamidase-related protein [Anaerolineales bacterium]HND90152.1 CinA family nicotinamide mononucleotide deamidase-related protein [Anaerolineales bacterium]HNF33402.1 CinA family nicotinamide mononucleotide deamidase-related protein [Anaerolineales ba
MTSAEIITIGTEILLGEIVDTNTRYIARTLRSMGVDLYRTITIGDNIDRIASAIHNSMERADIVITTGGLGPTVDDPTREAVAKAVGVETEFREDLWEQVVETIARYGRKPSENQKRQAYVPKGALGIRNPVGTAPCFIVETERNAVISLPGVPSEMEQILHESMIPYLQKRFNLNEIIKVRVLHCAGLGEGMIDEKIADLETLSNPTVGLAAHTGVVDVRIAAKARNENEANEMIAVIEAQVRERLGNVVFGADEDKLEEVTLDLVAKRGWALTAIESGLDGILARKIPHTASFSNLEPAQLLEALRAARAESKAEIALGVSVYSADRSAEMAMITPRGEKTHRITYGGPPRSLPKWAMNLALNWLRMTLEEFN